MTTALPMLSAAGAVKDFGQSVNNLLRHNVFAANDSAAMQKVRDIQMSKALWENGSMEEMILTDHSRDILGNFRTDTKAETNDKLQHLKDLGLDASGIEKEVLRRRAVLEAARRQRETEADTRAAQEVDQTRGREELPYAASSIYGTPTGRRMDFSSLLDLGKSAVNKVKSWFGDKGNDSDYITLENGARLPIGKGTEYSISSGFRTENRPTHDGVDIAVPENTPVVAPGDGTVVHVDERVDTRAGRYVIMKHENNIYSFFCHNNEILVQKGDPVNAGKPIAYSGNTGDSSGPHIHYEIVQGEEGSQWTDYWQRDRERPNPYRENPLEYMWGQ